MKKTLVYHMYIPKGDDYTYENYPGIYNLHFRYLERYADIFDKAIFVLTMDDLSEIDKKNWYIDIIKGLGFNREFDIKIRQNTDMREAVTFYDEIASKLRDIEGLVFFGHGKGMTNWMYNAENNVDWIGAEYFFNLEYWKFMTVDLINGDEIAAGILKCTDKEIISNTYHWRYSGTFFWMNPGALATYMEENNLKLRPVVNRMYAENFLGSYVPQYKTKSHDNRYLELDYEPLLYSNATEIIKQIVPEDEYMQFRKVNDELSYGLICKEDTKSSQGS